MQNTPEKQYFLSVLNTLKVVFYGAFLSRGRKKGSRTSRFCRSSTMLPSHALLTQLQAVAVGLTGIFGRDEMNQGNKWEQRRLSGYRLQLNGGPLSPDTGPAFSHNQRWVVFRERLGLGPRADINESGEVRRVTRQMTAGISRPLATVPCKAKRQYLLTLQVSRYCLLALQRTVAHENPVDQALLADSDTRITSYWWLAALFTSGAGSVHSLRAKPKGSICLLYK